MNLDNRSDFPEGYLANLSLEIKQSLSRSLRGFDREMVASKISTITKKKLSKAMLDKTVSSNPSYQASILQVQALCSITGNLEPFQCILKYFNADVLKPEDKELLERTGLLNHLSRHCRTQ